MSLYFSIETGFFQSEIQNNDALIIFIYNLIIFFPITRGDIALWKVNFYTNWFIKVE